MYPHLLVFVNCDSTVVGTAILKSRETVKPNMWMTVMAERNQRDGSLSINGGDAVKGTPLHSLYRDNDLLELLPCPVI